MHSGFLSYVFDAGSSEGSPPMLYAIGSRGRLQMISKQAVNWARQFHPQELFEWIFSLVVRCNFIVRLVGFGHTATVEFPGILLVSDLQVHWGKLRIPQNKLFFPPEQSAWNDDSNLLFSLSVLFSLRRPFLAIHPPKLEQLCIEAVDPLPLNLKVFGPFFMVFFS